MMKPDLLLDARAALGEGPVWHTRLGRLLWIDILGHAIHVTDPGTLEDRTVLLDQMVGCIAPAAGMQLVAGLRDGFAAVDLDTGAVRHIEDPEVHLPDNRFNDGKCDPAGRFWAGTMHTDETTCAGALYCLDTDLTVTLKIPGATISNGLAWSVDERTLYYIDSPTRQVVAYDYDRTSGIIVRPRPVFHVPGESGFPDGMTIDADGCLWIALWGASRVVRVDPDLGRIVASIEMPVSQPSSCTFGGPRYDELYITSARKELSHEQIAREPLAGGVFVCRPGVHGLPAVEFGGAV